MYPHPVLTLVPVLLGVFVRGRIHAEDRNPVSRALIRVYRPAIRWTLRWRWPAVAGAMASLLWPGSRCPAWAASSCRRWTGTILFMPTTLPGIGVAQARSILQRQDRILPSFPEVRSVFGKAGRASTATDPAGFDMAETTIVLRDPGEWRPGMTTERLVAAMGGAVRFPGVTIAWTMPIRAGSTCSPPASARPSASGSARLRHVGGDHDRLHRARGVAAAFLSITPEIPSGVNKAG